MQLDLVERARRGDHDAFAMLADAAIHRLDGAARLILRDPDKAKDAVQETLVRAWRRPADVAQSGSLRRLAPPAARAVVHRRGATATPAPPRRRARPVHAPAVADGISIDARPRPARSRVQPPRARGAGRRRHASLPRSAAARGSAGSGIPLGTAKSRLHRALGLMRAALDADARPRAEIGEGRPA